MRAYTLARRRDRLLTRRVRERFFFLVDFFRDFFRFFSCFFPAPRLRLFRGANNTPTAGAEREAYFNLNQRSKYRRARGGG